MSSNIARSVTGSIEPFRHGVAQAVQAATRETMAVGEINAAGGFRDRAQRDGGKPDRSET